MPSGIVLDLRNLGDLYDDSRNHHTITNHNAIPVRGIHGRGMDFNGTTAYLDCGNHSSLNITDAITIEAWMYSPNFVDNSMILGKGGGGGGAYHLRLVGSNTLQFGIRGAITTVRSTSGSILVEGDWYYVVGVYNKVNALLYINSEQIIGDAGSENIKTVVNDVLIGKDDAFGDRYFDGTIDEVRIYNYALDPDTIKLHYRQQSPYYKEEAPTICL